MAGLFGHRPIAPSVYGSLRRLRVEFEELTLLLEAAVLGSNKIAEDVSGVPATMTVLLLELVSQVYVVPASAMLMNPVHENVKIVVTKE